MLCFIAQAPFQNPWKYNKMKGREREKNQRERRKIMREIRERGRESEDRGVCITEIYKTLLSYGENQKLKSVCVCVYGPDKER